MAHMLPKFIAIKRTNITYILAKYAYFEAETDGTGGCVRCREENVYNSLVKIEVETAQIGRKYVHLRFCHSNKYWARRGPGTNDRWILLPPTNQRKIHGNYHFEPTIGNDGFLYLTHVQSGGRVRTNTTIGSPDLLRLYVDDKDDGVGHDYYAFEFVDWDTLVIMPQYVAFKGDNGKFLRDLWKKNHEYLQFSSNDGNEEYASYEILLHRDGYLIIKSVHYGKFWRRSPNWIWSDSNSIDNVDCQFWPVKVNDNTIALRNAGNNKFCKRLTTEGKTDCLNAAASSITSYARLIVEELVLERNIYDVRYRMEDARIYDERAFIAGIGTSSNDPSEPSSLTIKVSYEDTSSYSFTGGFSIMAGVKTSITTGFAKIVEGKIEISVEITTSFEWNTETSETKALEASYTLSVPPKNFYWSK